MAEREKLCGLKSVCCKKTVKLTTEISKALIRILQSRARNRCVTPNNDGAGEEERRATKMTELHQYLHRMGCPSTFFFACVTPRRIFFIQPLFWRLCRVCGSFVESFFFIFVLRKYWDRNEVHGTGDGRSRRVYFENFRSCGFFPPIRGLKRF